MTTEPMTTEPMTTEPRTTVQQGTDRPAVRPEVVAEVVAGLSARLQKRLDAAAAKLADRPVTREGDEWRIAVDEEATLVLHAPGGVVGTAADVRCGCLLAPACVHRAAAVTVCPLADADPAGAPDDGPDADPAGAPDTAGAPAAPTPGPDGGRAATDAPAPAPDTLTPAQQAAAAHLHRAASAVLAAGVSGAGAVLQAELLRAAHRARIAALYRPAAAAVAVVTGVRAARSGEPDHRLADLVTAQRDLLGLTTALTGAAAAATAGAAADGAAGAAAVPAVPLARLRGTARQTYEPAGGLRLHGLFTEPVLTSTHAGVLSWAVDADGRLSTVAEVMPHGDPTAAAPQALGAGNKPVRLGDTLLGHREFSRAGLAVQGATRSAAGRLGAGATVRAVRAAGAAWTADPLARLWAEPVAAQVRRALAATDRPQEDGPAGADLLFLDVTLLGSRAAADGGTREVVADCDGLPVVLRPAHDHPGLAYRANLALLAAAPGLRVRVIGRLVRAARPELRLLAVGQPPGDPVPGAPALAVPEDRAGRVNLGLERLQRADLAPATPVPPAAPPHAAPPDTGPTATGPAPAGPDARSTDTGPDTAPAQEPAPEAPAHLLGRRVEQVVTSGRRSLALAGSTAAADAGQLRAVGLATGAALLDTLRAAAGDLPRDVFGRVVPDDHGAFTAAWLAAACYREELAAALCEGAWTLP